VRRPSSWYPSVADQQNGAFTAAQAQAEGMPRSTVASRVETGRWVRVAGRALRVRDREATHATLLWAVELTWPDGIVCRALAARHWGAPAPLPREIDIVVPSQRRRLPGLFPRRIAVPPQEVLLWGDTLRITAERRSLLDSLACLPLDDARDLLAWTVAHERLRAVDLEADARERPDRHGNAQLRRLAREAAGGALSVAERRCHELLRRAGITGWQANVQVRDHAGVIGRADVLFEEARLVIEIDGYRAHGPEAFQRDRTRQNRLVAAGYRVLRFTWHDLVHRPGHVVAQVRAMLRR